VSGSCSMTCTQTCSSRYKVACNPSGTTYCVGTNLNAGPCSDYNGGTTSCNNAFFSCATVPAATIVCNGSTLPILVMDCPCTGTVSL
jgi:hypothetical protein